MAANLKLTLIDSVMGGGKSTLASYLISKRWSKQYEYGYVVGPTVIDSPPEWKKLSGLHFRYVYDRKSFQEFMSEFRERVMKMVARSNAEGKSPARGVIVLEDVIGTVSLSDDIITQFIVGIRHLYLHMYFLSQHPQKVPTILRSTASEIYFTYREEINTLKCLWGSYGQIDFAKVRDFGVHLHEVGRQKYVFIKYRRKEDTLKKRYIATMVPSSYITWRR